MNQPYYPQPPSPQQPMYPQYPQYPQSPVPQTAAVYPQQPMYPQQPYPQPPAQPLATGTLSDFFSQPSTGGGPVFSWKGKPIGTCYAGIVSRPITSADIQQQTMPGSTQGAFYRDGRPKFLMKIPMRVTPTPEFPDGEAQWWVSGRARDELARAMAEAGCEPNMSPEPGAAISITLTGERPAGPGMNNAKTFAVRYSRPQGALPANIPVHGEALAADIQRQMQQAQAQPPQPQPNIPLPQPVYAPVQQSQPHQPQPVQPQPQPVQPQQPQPQPVQPQPHPQQPQPVQPQAPMPQQANDLSPEQQALLAQIVNG